MINTLRKPILIETALLGQGLPSISNQQMLELWISNSLKLAHCYEDSKRTEKQFQNSYDAETRLVWMEQGNIIQGDLTRFLAVRMNPGMQRIDGIQLAAAREKGASGFLTASAVMRISTPGVITVSAGMGGIRNAKQSDDLFCLKTLPVIFIASAPKDALDLKKTIEYLFQHKTRINGWHTAQCDGFLFHLPPVIVPTLKVSPEVFIKQPSQSCLILNPIPASQRIDNWELLEKAVAAGVEAEKLGESFHPSVNAALDRFSGGLSSQMQMHALIENIKLAKYIHSHFAPGKEDAF